MHQLSLIPDNAPIRYGIVRGPEDRPREWRVYYPDGRTVSVLAGDRSGWGHVTACNMYGDPVGPQRISPSGRLLSRDELHPNYHDTGD